MKKLMTSLVVVALLVTSISFAPKKVEAKRFDCYTKEYLNCIKISWDKKKKAKKYIVHRALIKDPNTANMPKRSKFKTIKKTKKLSFKDKKAKKNKYYTYYVDAVNKKGKLIATTYTKKYSPGVSCKGFDEVEVSNRGYGDGYKNSPSKIYLEPDVGGYGVRPKKVKYIFYKKNKNESGGFKKFKPTLVDKDDTVYLDTKIKAGETYQYKIKAYAKKGKKKYYSKFSSVLEVYAVNFKANLHMDVLTPSGVYEDVEYINVDIKLTDNDKNNGKVVFFSSYTPNYPGEYICWEKEGDQNRNKDHRYLFSVEEYSENGTDWKTIPSKGVELPKNGSLYLRLKIKNYDNKRDTIIFAGPGYGYCYSVAESYDGYCKYYGSGGTGITDIQFDFVYYKATAYESE